MREKAMILRGINETINRSSVWEVIIRGRKENYIIIATFLSETKYGS